MNLLFLFKMVLNKDGSFLVWIVAVQLLVCGVCATDNTKDCKLLSESKSERKVLTRLEPLTKKE